MGCERLRANGTIMKKQKQRQNPRVRSPPSKTLLWFAVGVLRAFSALSSLIHYPQSFPPFHRIKTVFHKHTDRLRLVFSLCASLSVMSDQYCFWFVATSHSDVCI